ncbi:MAG: hypothetical protein EPN97_04295 [Alphaproteobacteria bacterium]|nr:MAG: hypothetical protein EPN97_04295 [Alphaproteobacteria bacterium]
MTIDTFSDCVESGRALEISVSTGMIFLRVTGGRYQDEFILDGDEVEAFVNSLRVARQTRVTHGGQGAGNLPQTVGFQKWLAEHTAEDQG